MTKALSFQELIIQEIEDIYPSFAAFLAGLTTERELTDVRLRELVMKYRPNYLDKFDTAFDAAFDRQRHTTSFAIDLARSELSIGHGKVFRYQPGVKTVYLVGVYWGNDAADDAIAAVKEIATPLLNYGHTAGVLNEFGTAALTRIIELLTEASK